MLLFGAATSSVPWALTRLDRSRTDGPDHNGCSAAVETGVERGPRACLTTHRAGAAHAVIAARYPTRLCCTAPLRNGDGRSGWATMPKRVERGFAACLGLAFACAAGAVPAVALDCAARWLGETEIAICRDPQLSRSEDQTTRRIAGFARRISFGQYLSLRHWHALWSEERSRCSLERACIAASYRVQARFLDRLQQCLDVSQQRRVCFRGTLNVEREAQRR